MPRPDMSIKVERQLHDMRILGRIVGVRSTEQSGIKGVKISFAHNIIIENMIVKINGTVEII